MSEHPTKEELFDLYHYKITGPRGKEVQTHVQNCQNCTQYLQDVKKVESSFATMPLSHPSEKTLQNILKYANKAVTKPSLGFFWAFKQTRVLGLAMSIMVITGLGILYYYNQDQFGIKVEQKDTENGMIVGSSSSPLEEDEKDLLATNQPGDDSLKMGFNLSKKEEEEMSPTEKFSWANQLKEKGECERAIKLYESVYSIQDKPFKPQDTLLFNWSLCLEKLGKKEEAKKYLLELKKINPTYPGIEVFLQRL